MIMVSSQDGFVASLRKALSDIDPNWENYPGIILTGTHAPDKINMDWAMQNIKDAREKKIPLLGLCFGLHIAVIEFSRNVLGMPTATSEELDPNALVKVIDALPEMRVGVKPVFDRMENHWHRFKVHDGLIPKLQPHFGMLYTENIVEQMELVGHPCFILTQYHPEYSSFPDDPHPVLVKFLDACREYHRTHANRN